MMSTGSVELRTAAESSSKSLGTVADGVRTNAQNAAMANQIVSEASRTARSGQERMTELSGAISDVQGAAQQIARIIRVIDEIAFQTNLLALNAAVEAARAGRHGKGFAVVAQEVRTLAERSARAAKETAQLIEDTGAKVEQGVRLTSATRSALEEIVGSVVKIVDLVGEIDAASSEQARSLQQVSGSVTQVTESAQSGSQQSIEVAAAAEELGRQMAVLKQRMDRYKVPPAPAVAALAGQLPPALLDQIMALVRAANGGSPSRELAAAVGAAARAVPDPRAVLPLDRDERGYEGF
jgi:methyl-accepting chemotaxis protein